MSIHDYVIANQNGANTRADLNNALAAIVSNNSSATEPSTTYAFMWWADTANDLLKQRNAADSAWISILTLSTGKPTVGTTLADLSITATDSEIDVLDMSGSGSSAGQVLTSTGTGTVPTWQTVSGGADTSLSNLSATGENKIAQAWVNFKTDAGTPTINDSHNVSSIGDWGTGSFGIYIASSFSNANYCPVGMGEDRRYMSINVDNTIPQTGRLDVYCTHSNGFDYDMPRNNVAIFGDM